MAAQGGDRATTSAAGSNNRQASEPQHCDRLSGVDRGAGGAFGKDEAVAMGGVAASVADAGGAENTGVQGAVPR